MYRIHTWAVCALCCFFVSSQLAIDEKSPFLTSDDELVRQLFELEYRPKEKQLIQSTAHINTYYTHIIDWTAKTTALIALWYGLHYLYQCNIHTKH